ncbi:MAG TPA: CPBP family intramembrane glutamic endopeptidase [Pirellulaceae bacterium]
MALLVGMLRPEFGFSSSNPLYYVAAYGPSIAAFVVVGRWEGWAGIKRLLSRLVPRRASVPWYPVVLIGYPAVILLAGRIADPDIFAKLPSWDRLIWLLAISLFVDAGPMGEETGWRGFALPQLLRWRSPLAAALILGAVWFAWHLPTFFISTLSQSHLSIPLFLLNSLVLSVIMTWIFLRTEGDVLLMILFHLVGNDCVGVLHVPFKAELAAEVIWAALIVAAGGLQGLPPASRETGKAGNAERLGVGI